MEVCRDGIRKLELVDEKHEEDDEDMWEGDLTIEEEERMRKAWQERCRKQLEPPPLPPLEFTDASSDSDLEYCRDDPYGFENTPLEVLRKHNPLYHDDVEESDDGESDEDLVYDPDSSDEYQRGEKRREYEISFMEGKAVGSRCKKVLKEVGCSRLKYCRFGGNKSFTARLTSVQARKVAGREDIRLIERLHRFMPVH